jgi:hypothetical protein
VIEATDDDVTMGVAGRTGGHAPQSTGRGVP